MSEILTAPQFLQSGNFDPEIKQNADLARHMHRYAVMFAKHHVQLAVNACSKKARTKNEIIQPDGQPCKFKVTLVDRDSILNAYPEDNIK